MIKTSKLKDHVKIKKAIFSCGAIIYGLYRKNVTGEQASFIMLSGSYPNKRRLIAEELVDKGYVPVDINESYVIFKTPNLFCFSHKKGNIILDSKHPFRLVEANGKLA